MKIDFHKKFEKQFQKQPVAIRAKFKARLALFVSNQNDPVLYNHPLKGQYQGYQSINVSGDVRAVFMMHAVDHAEFVYIGTHSQLYR